MRQFKTILLILSSAFIIYACSDTSSSGPDPDPEPIEPTVSVNNPSEGTLLEGEITFSISGEAEDGFDEARIFVGEQQIETLTNPSLPIDQTISTIDYNNGDYDLRAELDVTNEDTTVEASIGVTLENYFVEFSTDGYIAQLADENDAAYLFIADPDGNVLREIELTTRSDGNIQLLPPSAFEGDAPEHFSITIGEQDTDSDGNQIFNLDTDAGFQAWSDISRTVESPPSENTVEIPVTYTNIPPATILLQGFPDLGGGANIEVPETTQEIYFTAHILPDFDFSKFYDGALFYLEEGVQDSLNGSGSLQYDVANTFEPMETTRLNLPPDYNVSSFFSYLAKPEGFPDRYNTFGVGGSITPENDELLLGAPDVENRSVGYSVELSDASGNGVRLTERTSGDVLPDEFSVLDGSISLDDASLGDTKFDVSGSADYIRFFVGNNTVTSQWRVTLPDTSSSFVFPAIEDSLNTSVTVFSRSDLALTRTSMVDYDDFDGYMDYIDIKYGSIPSVFPFDFQEWSKSLQPFQNSKVRSNKNNQLLFEGEDGKIIKVSNHNRYLNIR